MRSGFSLWRSTGPAAVLIVLLAACGESAVTPAGGDGSATTAATSSTSPGAPTEELRELAFAYWEAFNAYDPDRVLSYLEEGYRASREDPIRSEIRQIDAFGVQLGVTEASPPVMLSDDTAEMFLELKNPLGVKRIRMAFELIDGAWMITYAQEVP